MVLKNARSAGLRIKAFRILIGKTQKEFAEFLGLDHLRVVNVENGRAKANEDDLMAICTEFPESSEWLAYGGNIELARLKVGKTAEHAHALGLIEEEDVPKILRNKIR